jgi:hypothetical protein
MAVRATLAAIVVARSCMALPEDPPPEGFRGGGPPEATAPIVVAARHLRVGEIVDAVDVCVADVPLADRPEDAVAPDVAVVGRASTAVVLPGQALRAGALTGEADLRRHLAPGERAVSVPLIPEAPLPERGSRVDLDFGDVTFGGLRVIGVGADGVVVRTDPETALRLATAGILGVAEAEVTGLPVQGWDRADPPRRCDARAEPIRRELRCFELTTLHGDQRTTLWVAQDGSACSPTP